MKIRAPFRPANLLLIIAACAVLAVPVLAKDEWLQVRSKNFFLIGNASEKDIHKVATRLEQFRETFRLLFSKTNFSSSIPTNVIVFKSESAYKPFKPKRADGKLDTFVAGYFQPGEDVNYITLSTEGEDAETFDTIFHEYVHSIVNTNFGKSEVPPWFNEGLAEYYSTFQIENDQKAKLGLPKVGHLQLLQQSKLIPLDQLFRITNYQLPQSGDHSRSIFYAESWALMHYLIQGNKGEALSKFLALVLKDVPQEKAFHDAFQMTYGDMEKDLRSYVGKASYQYMSYQFPQKLTFEAEMTTEPVNEATSNAYLGDLLYHVNRADDAESYLTTAVKLQPNMSMANTTLGMVKVRQRKFDEAKGYLEKAMAGDQKNHMAYYQYAYLLSREGRDEFGYVRSFPPETAAKMRDALKRSIALKPDFAESYELFAFVNLVNDEQLDESIAMLRKALQYQPGNQKYAMRIAEILAHQSRYDDASALATKLATTTDDPEIKNRAESLAGQIAQHRQYDEQRKKYEETASRSRSGSSSGSPGGGVGPPLLLKRKADERPMTDEDWAKVQAVARLRSINGALRKTDAGENRVMGQIAKVECKGGVTFTIKVETETFQLQSKSFQELYLQAFVPEAMNTPVGCGGDLSKFIALVTYKPRTGTKTPVRGDLTALEFVPKDFRILSQADIDSPEISADDADEVEVSATSPTPTENRTVEAPRDLDAMRREAIMKQIKENLRQPAAGEKREMGFLDKIECTPKGNFFYLRTTSQTLKLLSNPTLPPKIILHTNDLEGVQFGCQLKAIEVPAVFVYKDAPNEKTKSMGDIVSLDFVPKSFVLE
ncbi:MAG: tetratricopeptide repeat protein [Acidobacteriota bacterium]